MTLLFSNMLFLLLKCPNNLSLLPIFARYVLHRNIFSWFIVLVRSGYLSSAFFKILLFPNNALFGIIWRYITIFFRLWNISSILFQPHEFCICFGKAFVVLLNCWTWAKSVCIFLPKSFLPFCKVRFNILCKSAVYCLSLVNPSLFFCQVSEGKLLQHYFNAR